MEYLEGGELLSLLQKKGKLTEDEAKLFVRQIVEAINYCHNQNLIHRDLKLENILLEQKNSSKVIIPPSYLRSKSSISEYRGYRLFK